VLSGGGGPPLGGPSFNSGGGGAAPSGMSYGGGRGGQSSYGGGSGGDRFNNYKPGPMNPPRRY
jgi:hypothetical protein